MDRSFDPKTAQILDFGHYRPSHYRELKRIAFPAYAYRVLCPIPTGNRLNPFQRAILHFSSIGVTDTVKMAENLCLHPDLMALVTTELQGMGLVQNKGELTPKGKQALNDDEGMNYQIQTAYVFQNIWTGSLLPRVKPQMQYAEVEYDEDGSPLVRWGSHGDPKRFSPFFIYGSDMPHEPIEAEAILRAVQLHSRHSKGSDASDEVDLDDEIISLPMRIDRVRSISQSPSAVYLLTSLYFLEDSFYDGWYVGDPFGLGMAPWLYQSIQLHRQQNGGLNRWLESLESKNKRQIISAERDDDISLLAEEALVDILGSDIYQHPYYQQLFDFEYRMYEIRQTQRGSCDDLIVKLAKIAERIMQDMQSESPHSIKYPKMDRGFRQQQLDQFASQIGLESPVPDYYTNISPHKVNRAVKKSEGTIAELLIALMLGAAHDEGHPLRQVARSEPNTLTHLEQLAMDRNKSAHASNQKFEMENVENHRHHVFNFLKAILKNKE